MNPFADDEETTEVAFDRQETTGINFNAYEDKPMVVSTFAEIDLGDENTPVEVSHAIPILLAGRDLMVCCAQTGSGKTTAFCFPIISGIIRGPPSQWQRGSRAVYPPALILSPTRELSVQEREQALRSFKSGATPILVGGHSFGSDSSIGSDGGGDYWL